MKKLKINLSKFDNSKLLAFGEGLKKIIKALTGIDAVRQPFEQSLEKCIEAVNNVLEKIKAKEVSEKLKTEDNFRDEMLVGINKLFDAQEYNPNEEVRIAAAELNMLFNKIGNGATRLAYDTESTIIKTLITDFTGDYASQISVCKAESFVEALKESQNRFDLFREQQLQENAETSQIIAMSSIRREFENNTRALLEIMPVMHQLNPSTEFKTAIELTEQLIQKFKY